MSLFSMEKLVKSFATIAAWKALGILPVNCPGNLMRFHPILLGESPKDLMESSLKACSSLLPKSGKCCGLQNSVNCQNYSCLILFKCYWHSLEVCRLLSCFEIGPIKRCLKGMILADWFHLNVTGRVCWSVLSRFTIGPITRCPQRVTWSSQILW